MERMEIRMLISSFSQPYHCLLGYRHVSVAVINPHRPEENKLEFILHCTIANFSLVLLSLPNKKLFTSFIPKVISMFCSDVKKKWEELQTLPADGDRLRTELTITSLLNVSSCLNLLIY